MAPRILFLFLSFAFFFSWKACRRSDGRGAHSDNAPTVVPGEAVDRVTSMAIFLNGIGVDGGRGQRMGGTLSRVEASATYHLPQEEHVCILRLHCISMLRPWTVNNSTDENNPHTINKQEKFRRESYASIAQTSKPCPTIKYTA